MDSFFNELLNSSQISPALFIPVVLVITSAILIFVYGIRKPKEPQFKKIAASVQSSSLTKKTKRKDKPSTTSTQKTATSANGVVKTAQRSPTKNENKRSPAENKKKEQKEEQQPANKSKGSTVKKPVQQSNKIVKKPTTPKLEKDKRKSATNDLDSDGWTTVQSRTDKKKKQDDLILLHTLDAAAAANQSKKSINIDSNKTQSGKSTKNSKQFKDQVNKSKKEASEINKKNQKNQNVTNSNQQLEETIVKLVMETKHNIIENIKKIDNIIENANSNNIGDEKSDDSKPVAGVIFNELEDTWTEAKPIKKGKKKARKE